MKETKITTMKLNQIDKKYEYWVNMHDDKGSSLIAKIYADGPDSAEVCLKSITKAYLDKMKNSPSPEDVEDFMSISYIILQVPRNLLDEDVHSLN